MDRTLLWVLLLAALTSEIRTELCLEKVCNYTLVIEQRSSHLFKDAEARYEVTLDGSALVIKPNLFRDKLVGRRVPEHKNRHVITLDGHQRDVIVINDHFPGPTMEVLEGSQVVVKVVNQMFHDSTTLHFHGLHQYNNLWMDGVPYVTQCPIMPGQNFTYRFMAQPAGTHWYHSHLSDQSMDGLYGMIIVHPQEPTLPYHIMSVMEWLHPPAETIRADNPFAAGNYQTNSLGAGRYYLNHANRRYSYANTLDTVYPFYSILVNGRGRQMHSTEKWPLEMFEVESHAGHNLWRFHVAHTGSESMLHVSVDQHQLSIVATDDGDIDSIPVDSFYIAAGETIDFTLKMDQPAGSYWIRLETTGTRPGAGQPVDGMVNEGRAILKYDTVVGDAEPESSPNECSQSKPCHVFNCPFERSPAAVYKVCIHMDESRSVKSQEELNDMFALQSPPDHEIMLNFNLGSGANINGHEFVYPHQPLFSTADYRKTPCDAEHCQNGCKCTHTINLGEGQIVQLVLTNYESNHDGQYSAHPIHLHGYSFALLKLGFGQLDPATGLPLGDNPDVNCTTPNCSWTQWTTDNPRARMNMERPPLKNTVLVPAQGYAVVRIKTDNLGYWLLHCHGQRHMHSMAMLVYVISLPTLPEGFPYCGAFDFDGPEDFKSYLDEQSRRQRQHEG